MPWTVNPDHGYLDWHDGLGSSVPIVSIDVDTNTAPGTDPVVADGTNTIAITGGQTANASLSNVIQTHSYAANEFTIEIQQSGSATTEDTSLNGVSHFNSDEFTVSNGFVSLVGGSAGIDSIGVDTISGPGTNPVLPDGSGLISVTGGQVNASVIGANVIRTISTTENEYTIEVQQAGATAAANTDANGVAHFNNTQFTVTNGFVELIGGGIALDSIGVDAISGTGTNPVAPDGSGEITVTGGQIATGTIGSNVIRTISESANNYTVQIQQASSSSAADTTLNGVAHFDSSQFTVTTGYVEITNFSPFNYVQIANGDSPYAATSTDYFISCNSSGGAITVQLPNAPTTYRMFVIKDRTASASANNITVTTVGGAVNIDGATSQLITSNYGSLTLMFNGTSYEIF